MKTTHSALRMVDRGFAASAFHPPRFALPLLLAAVLGGAGWAQPTFVDLANGVPTNGVAIPDQFSDPSVGTFHNVQYRIAVPAGATSLTVMLVFNAPLVDLDLFLNLGSQVTAQDFDASSESFTSIEMILLNAGSNPPLSAGTYYLAIVNYTEAEVPFTITATYEGGTTAKADLVVNTFGWTGATVTEGNAFFIQPTVANDGLATAPASHIRLFLSTDNDFNYSNDYEVLPEMSVPSLAPQTSAQVRWDFAFPDLADTATYNVWPVFLVDSRNEVDESNENNVFKANNPVVVTNAAVGPTSTPTPTRTPTPTPTSPGPSRQVTVGSTSGAAGAGVSLTVSVDNLADVAGLELDLAFNGAQVVAGQATLGGAASNFRLRSNPETGRLRVAMARATGLSAGGGVMLNLPFTIGGGLAGGTNVPITVSAVRLFSISGAINAAGVAGQISVTGGAATNTSTPTPTPTATRTPTPTPTTPGPGRQVVVSTGSGAPGSQVTLSVSVDNGQDVAGLELDLAFNGTLLTPHAAQLGGSAGSFRLRSNPQTGRVRAAMARSSGLSSGAATLLSLPFTISGGASAGSDLPITVSAVNLYGIGGTLPATGVAGQISVSGGAATNTFTPTPTPTPTATRTPTPTATQQGATPTPTPTTPPGVYHADINNDGVVDERDLLLFMADWHRAVPTRGPGEPGGGLATLEGRVLHPDTGAGLAGVTLTLFDVESRPLAATSSGTGGAYSLPEVAPGYYRLNASLGGYIPTDLYQSVPSAGTVGVRDLYLVSGSPGNGNLSGRVINAVNGAGVGGAKVELRAGLGALLGAPDRSLNTLSNGTFTATGVPAGCYTARAVVAGYSLGSGMVLVYPNDSKAQPDLPVSPQLGEGEVRVLLTWGAAPEDLDAHITGPEGAGRFHVYYGNRGSSTAAPFTSLDLDDRNGFGPETITIKQRNPGVYRFSVHDYSNRNDAQNTALSETSGAMVSVYDSSGLLASYTVPRGQTGTIWRVFELDGVTGQLTPINTFHFGAADQAGNFKSGRDAEAWSAGSLPRKD